MGACSRALLLSFLVVLAGCDWGDGGGTSPQAVAPASEFRLAAGKYHSLALGFEGNVWAWGGNYNGALGNGGTVSSTSPIPVPGLNNVVAVAAAAYSLALRADGSVWAWGWNELGYGGPARNIPFLCTPGFPNTGGVTVPTPVAGLDHVVQVLAGSMNAFVLKSDGTVWAWGSNTDGQLGNGIAADSSCLPQQVAGLAGITAVAGGDGFALALRNDGTVWAWGYNGNGALGNGTLLSSNVPVQVPGLSGVVAIAAGSHALALTGDGAVWAWGLNTSGQVGDLSATERCGLAYELYPPYCVKRPTKVEGVGRVSKIVAGDSSTFAMTEQGQVWAWGNSHALGTSQSTSTCSIAHVSWPCVRKPLRMPELESFRSIVRGNGHALALKPDGSVWSWGGNYDGQLGNDSHTDSVSAVRVLGLAGQGWLNLDAPAFGVVLP